MSKRIWSTRVNVGDKLRSGVGLKLRIMAGNLGHITGTTSSFRLYDENNVVIVTIIQVASGTGSATFQLNDKITTNKVYAVETKEIWIDHDHYFKLTTGGTGAHLDLLLEQVPL